MSSTTYEIGKTPHVIIKAVRGDLNIRAWQESRVAVSGNFQAEEVESGLTLSADGSLSLRLPEAASLTVIEVSGEMNIRGVQGALQLGQVRGDLVVKNAGQVSLEGVNGDLVLVNLNGDAIINEVNGDVSMRRIRGVQLGSVHGDLAGRYIDGSVDVGQGYGDISLNTVSDDLTIGLCQRDANLRNLGGINLVELAHGDIRLRGSLMPGKHSFKAEGDIVSRWPANAPLNLTAKATSIENRLPLEDQVEEEGALSGRIGNGETTLVLEAKGRIILKQSDPVEEQGWNDVGSEFSDFGADMAGFGAEMAGLSERIAGEIESQMSQMSARLENKFGPEFGQKMAEKAARHAEKAVQRVARHAERSRRRAETRDRWSSPAPSKKTPSISPEEQRKVLEMLEKGLISVEEANALLKAMDG